MQTVKIVDPDALTLCDTDQVGEIWVHSASVAQGYWQQDEETEHAFHGKIKNDPSQQTYLRTGDLGFIHDNELYVTGRIKDLIILYGKNHYPQDIEYAILHAPIHTLLGKCAAFVVQTGHEYQLTVLCEVKNRFMEPAEQEALFNAIFELVYQSHQLEIHTIILIPLKAMPHTTSGKIRRNFCRNYLLDKTLPIVALILFTSGTTGQVKAVQLSQKNILANCQAVIKALEFSQVQEQLLFLPLSYSFGLLGQLLPGLIAGITTKLLFFPMQ